MLKSILDAIIKYFSPKVMDHKYETYSPKRTLLRTEN